MTATTHESTTSQLSLIDILLAIGVMLIWGLNFVVAKLGLAEFSPIFMMALRFALVAALVVPFTQVPELGQLCRIAWISFLGSVHFPMMFSGLSGVDASVAAIATQVQVPFTAIIAHYLLGDRLGWRRALGMIVAFVGVALIAGEPRTTTQPGALALVLGAALVWAIVNFQVKGLGPIDVFQLSGWIALMATPQLLVISLVFESGQWQQLQQASWVGWASLLFQSVAVAILSHGLWYKLVRRYPINQVMPFNLLAPLFGVLAASLFLSEKMTVFFVCGGALALTGVGIIVLHRPR